MENCPVCRALLNGAETCRRCRVELKTAQALERQAQQLAGAAMHSMLLGDRAGAARLLRRAHVVHATLEVRILSAILDESTRRDDWDPHSPHGVNIRRVSSE